MATMVFSPRDLPMLDSRKVELRRCRFKLTHAALQSGIFKSNEWADEFPPSQPHFTFFLGFFLATLLRIDKRKHFLSLLLKQVLNNSRSQS